MRSMLDQRARRSATKTCPKIHKQGNFHFQNSKELSSPQHYYEVLTPNKAMTSFTNTAILLHARINIKLQPHQLPSTTIRASLHGEENTTCRRRIFTTLSATSLALGGVLNPATTPTALAQNWGTRSFIKERFFEPGLSPEDAVARIKQTAEGLHSIRDMLESMSWRYVLFYIRLKSSYLSQDLKNAMTTLPQGRRKDYVKAANELVDNMAEFDYYVRTPKVYESYLFYEKTLKSIDNVVALLA